MFDKLWITDVLPDHAVGECPLAFFAVDIAPFQEFCCFTIKVAVHQSSPEYGVSPRSYVFVISAYNICFYYVGQKLKSKEPKKIYITIILATDTEVNNCFSIY